MLWFNLKIVPSPSVVFRYSSVSSSREPFTHQATGRVRFHCTNPVIPGTVWSNWRWGLPSPHVAAWFVGISIRFLWSPCFVDWNRVITPVEAVSGPHQADPHLFPWWCRLPREGQNELVFPPIGNLHQVSSHTFTVNLGLVPSPGYATCMIAKAFKLLPSLRTTRGPCEKKLN